MFYIYSDMTKMFYFQKIRLNRGGSQDPNIANKIVTHSIPFSRLICHH